LDEEDSIDNVVVSMCAISSNSQLSTMRFKGKLGTREICALFDSGRTHSFVNPNALQGVKCKIVDTVLIVAEGTKVVTDSKCLDLQFSLQNNDFSGDLRILNIQSYDIILGWIG
jgi:Retroviral aspartyl protease